LTRGAEEAAGWADDAADEDAADDAPAAVPDSRARLVKRTGNGDDDRRNR